MFRYRLSMAALVVVAAALTGHLLHQVRAERADSAELRKQVAALQLELQAARSLAAPPTVAVPQVAQQVAPPPQTIPAQPATTAGSPASFVPGSTAPFTLDPRTRIYPDYARDLGLSATVADELTRLLRERATDDQIQALLGLKYAEFKAFEAAPEAGRVADELRRSLAATDHPLADADARRLVTAIVAEAERLKAETRPPTVMTDPETELMRFRENLAQARTESNRRIVEAASAYLRPEQVFALQSYYSRQQGSERQMLDIRRGQLQGGTGTIGN